MSPNQRYREQIDACRPGTGDLALPALADLTKSMENDRALAGELARSQRFDRAVSVALHDVPLPAGLLERLEVKIAAADRTDDPDTSSEVSLPAHPSRVSRRLLLAGASLTGALVLMLAVASQFWSPTPRRVPQDQLTAAVSQWIQQSSPNNTAWQPASQSVPKVLPVALKCRGQRNFVTANRESAVAYDLTPTGRQQVLLFVVKTPHDYAVRSSPYSRLTGASGGMAALAAWQKNGTLYVLAVVEVGQKLDDFIGQQPLARASDLPGLRQARKPAARPA